MAQLLFQCAYARLELLLFLVFVIFFHFELLLDDHQTGLQSIDLHLLLLVDRGWSRVLLARPGHLAVLRYRRSLLVFGFDCQRIELDVRLVLHDLIADVSAHIWRWALSTGSGVRLLASLVEMVIRMGITVGAPG